MTSSAPSPRRRWQSFTSAYGGLAVKVPANQAKDLLAVPGVVAVQADSLEHTLTDSTPAFIGATKVRPSLGGSNKAGAGVIVGVLDSGVWPEHPSFDDPGIPTPRAARSPASSVTAAAPRSAPSSPATTSWSVHTSSSTPTSAWSARRRASTAPPPPAPARPVTRRATARTLPPRPPAAPSRTPRARRRPWPGQRHRARRLGDRLPDLPRAGLLRLRLGRRHRSRRSRTASTSSTSRSAAAPTPTPTRSSSPSSTRRRPASASTPRPATPAPAPAPPTTARRGSPPWAPPPPNATSSRP